MLDHMSAALEEEALTGAESQARRIEALRLEALAVSPAVVAGGRPGETVTRAWSQKHGRRALRTR